MYSYSEDKLVEQPAIVLFVKELGYSHLNCLNEVMGIDSELGRRNRSEVVLKKKLKKALVLLNPNIPLQTIDDAIEEIVKDRSVLSLEKANCEIHQWLKDGIKIAGKDETGKLETYTVELIDFDNPENNDFFLASQFWVTGEMYTRRPDLIGFINGLPLIFIELKTSHKQIEDAYNNNLLDYKDTIPHLLRYNSFIILSNGSESKIGTISSSWEHFNDWKKINSEGEVGIISLDSILKGTCEKNRFLDILENFIMFEDIDGSFTKIIAKNHQYLGVNNAIVHYQNRKNLNGRLGVFWHTQGSGKSFSMIFFTQKILRKFEGSPTFVIVTDRIELDKQIYKNFANTGAVTEAEVHARDGKHLQKLLKEQHRTVFTLIQKFGIEKGQEYPELSTRSDIIVMTDEAHRTQYDELAKNMRTALPNASYIAFTGTPLIVGEERTREVFGDYASIYNFKQSIDDGATVPLYYENRLPEVQIINEEFDEELNKVIENAMLSPEQEKKLEIQLGQKYEIITRDDRLEKVAEDIVDHFMNRGYMGKAMVVCIDKPTTVKMYDKVTKHWDNYKKSLQIKLNNSTDSDEIKRLTNDIKYMKATDLAVVVSPEQNEIRKFDKLGLDILKHRKRMNAEDLSSKFKEPDDLFRIVFVCAMWMTGFDAKPLSTIYLDKPLKNHSLMQTIARINRVYGEKPSGLIIDYYGVFGPLQKALAIYGSDPRGLLIEGDSPVKPKKQLLEELEKVLAQTSKFCKDRGIESNKIIEAKEFLKIKLLEDAVDSLLVTEKTKNEFLLLVKSVRKLYKAILPDKAANKYITAVALYLILAEKIRSLDPTVDISEVMEEISKLLDRSIAAEGFIIKEAVDPETEQQIDLRTLNLDSIREKFIKGRKNIQVETLINTIRVKLRLMIELNNSRKDLAKKFRELVDEYNAGVFNVDIFFEKLLTFTEELKAEEKRGIIEKLSEEELAIFDLLFKDDLTKKEKDQVKEAAKELLKSLKDRRKLVLDWRKKQKTLAAVRVAIEIELEKRLPNSYDQKLYYRKCDQIYQHIYDNYFGEKQSTYTKPTTSGG